MKPKLLFITLSVLVFVSCGSSKDATTTSKEEPLAQTLTKKNRQNISLRDQIRQLPGIVIRNGVPVFNKNTGGFQQNNIYEPLYVLDNYVVGNSFREVTQLVRNLDVDKIEVLKGTDAAYYGSRASAGVIKITTLQ